MLRESNLLGYGSTAGQPGGKVVVPSPSGAPAPHRRRWVPSPRSQREALHDTVLVRRCQAGDETAFEEIVARYRDKLMFAAYGVLHNRSDAEEIALDALARAYRGLPSFRGDCALDTWLTHIALNLARNRYWYFIRRHRSAWVSLDATAGDDETATILDLVGDDAASPARALATAEFSTLVTRTMKQLKPHQREILALRNVQHRSYLEIARMLRLEPGTVKSRLGRARHALRRQIAAHCPEFLPDASPAEWLDLRRTGGRIRALCA